LGVEQYAAAGRRVEIPRLDCPGCGRAMGWWSGYVRWVRVQGRVWRVWVRRARCAPCRVTHALLPSFVLARRVDAVEVIGAALERAAAGVGLRPIAAWLGVPHSTVRGWRRRFVRRAGLLAAWRVAHRRGVAWDHHEPTLGRAWGPGWMPPVPDPP